MYPACLASTARMKAIPLCESLHTRPCNPRDGRVIHTMAAFTAFTTISVLNTITGKSKAAGAVAVPVAGLTKEFFDHIQKDFLINVRDESVGDGQG